MGPPTAYMQFCNDNRKAAVQRLTEAGHDKIAVTLVAKELGKTWKLLSDEEKAAYKLRASEQAQQATGGDVAQQGSPDQQESHDVGAGKVSAVAALPTAWVRRVVGLDPEIQRCSADALVALSTAADVFIGAFCARATAAATGAKRRTVRLDDIERCVRTDKRLTAIGLNAVMSIVAASAASNTEWGKAGKADLANKKPRLEKATACLNNSIERAFGLD